MLDPGEDLGLEEESLNGPRVGGRAGENHLERDRAVQLRCLAL